ncbi:hypothetical protein [Asanoa siamensis]|uniref:Uncharacterized protein n=1 Tax=Asanoa siamensis TaxID=926357 RepID=A0ABQ4D4P5_9ACTN|nr:hypothetical protein [Asanoa siamensis]GIF78497.1 hypothetical protein Asi02nite_80150 [Asanoa siamensis]
MTDYRDLITELEATVSRRATDLAAAERAYHDGMTAAAAELRRAEENARETDRRAAAAAATVVEVDQEAERLWSDLQRTRTWPGQRAGATPDPAPATAQPRLDLAEDATATLLAETAHRIHGAHPRAGAPPTDGKLPLFVLPLLPLLGASATATTTAFAAALAGLGTLDIPAADLLRVLGWLAYFAAPFAGLPIATRWTHRRWSTRLDTGGFALTVLGGLCALSAVIVTLT